MDWTARPACLHSVLGSLVRVLKAEWVLEYPGEWYAGQLVGDVRNLGTDASTRAYGVIAILVWEDEKRVFLRAMLLLLQLLLLFLACEEEGLKRLRG
jgi:hypothetical protein